MTEDEFRRASDLIASRTEQKLDDFIERYERDQDSSYAWRLTIDSRLIPLEEMAKKIRTPLQIVGIVCLAAFGGLGLSIFKWLERHFNQ